MSSMPSIDAVETGNWIPDVNRFNLPKPPAWFLKLLWDQDAALVVLPSRQSQKYIIARRRSQSLAMATVLEKQTEAIKKHQRAPYSDGDMLESRKLVKVDAIQSITGNVFSASWMASAPGMLSELRDRDMWAAGGAEKYIEKIEAREKQAEEHKRASMIDNIEHRAADAWRSYQARTGQRNQRANSRPAAKIVHVGTL